MIYYYLVCFTKTGTQEELSKLLMPYVEQTNLQAYQLKEDEVAKLQDDFAQANTRLSFKTWIGLNTECFWDEQTCRPCKLINPSAMFNYIVADNVDSMLEVKRGKEEFRKNNVYFVDNDLCEMSGDFWDKFIDCKIPKTEEDNNLSVIDPQYFKAHYKTRTNYVRSASEFIPTAYITPDGAWHTYATADAAGYQEFVDAWHRYLNSAENPFVDILLVCRK